MNNQETSKRNQVQNTQTLLPPHPTPRPPKQDPAGHHSSALFVQWVPFELAGTSWEAEEGRYVERLLAICDSFAPGKGGRMKGGCNCQERPAPIATTAKRANRHVRLPPPGRSRRGQKQSCGRKP
jgi:hypothetical protein